MNKRRFNQLNRKIKKLNPNAPLILKLDCDALLDEINLKQYNLPQITLEHDNHNNPMQSQPGKSTQTNDTPSKDGKKSSNKKEEINSEQHTKYNLLSTKNFFFWNLNSHSVVENRWIGRTMFFSNNKIIPKGVAKKHINPTSETNEHGISSTKSQ